MPGSLSPLARQYLAAGMRRGLWLASRPVPAVIPQPSGAAKYVSIYGSDNTGTGSFESPWRTITHGASHLVPGDTMYVRQGSYNEVATVSVSGTSVQPIVIANYPGESPVVDGGYVYLDSDPYRSIGLPVYHDGSYLVWISGEYVTWHGIDAKNSNGSIFLVRGAHSTVEYCKGYYAYGGGLHIQRDYCQGLFVELHTCEFENYHNHSSPPAWNGTVGFGRYPRYGYANGLVVHDSWGEGIASYESHDILIENCVVWNCQTNFYISDTYNTTFRNNVVYTTTSGNLVGDYTYQPGYYIGDEKGIPGEPWPNTAIRITSHDNHIYNCSAINADRNMMIGANVMGGLTVYNNTLVDAKDDYDLVLFAGAIPSPGAVFKNNLIIQGGTQGSGINGASGPVVFDHNIWSKTPTTGSMLGTNSQVIANPGLLRTGSLTPGGITKDYFKVGASSPVRNAGIAVGTDTGEGLDCFGTRRSNPPDVGAYEYPD